MSSARQPPVLIGWTEYVEFPEWKVNKVRDKIDTGARSSALHVENIELLPGCRVAFDVVRNRKSNRAHRRVVARVSRTGRVRSSTGHATQRVFIETLIRLGPIEKRIELSLTDRGSMIHRMLIGRTALGGSFLIDAHKRLMLGNPEKRYKRPPRRVSR